MVLTIIPAKPFNESKTRLSPILSINERAALSRRLLIRTIQVARGIGSVVVVSRGVEVLALAAEMGAETLVERVPDLNAAIKQGLHWAQKRAAIGALIIPMDLPYLKIDDLEQMIAYGRQRTDNVVIAPCQHHLGTNALYLSPVNIITPSFGPLSFAAHQQAAQSVGIEAQIYHSPNLAFDLDSPAEWHDFIAADHPCLTQTV